MEQHGDTFVNEQLMTMFPQLPPTHMQACVSRMRSHIVAVGPDQRPLRRLLKFENK